VTCREIADFLADYAAGALTDDVRAAFERHLAVCPNCRAYLATYRATIAAGRRVFARPSADAAGEIPADLLAAIINVLRK
jgi:anti-sigma factor RsiW